MTNNLRSDIIACFEDSILSQIIMDNDYEEYDNGDFLDTVKTAFADLEYTPVEIKDILNNIDDDEIIDDVIYGNGEYWRQEYGIYSLEDELSGDEFLIAMNNVYKKLGV